MSKETYKPTPEQVKAIELDGRILVSASAGSGKTTTLVKRIIRQLEEGASLRRMLILVYNNAAADELREKLRAKLFECACEKDGEDGKKFRQELDEISFAEICTIHAFCRDLIRNNFELLGISPSFRVLDEDAHNIYMAKAFDDLISEYSEKDDEVFERLTTVFECKRSEESIRKFVYTLFGVFDVQPDREAFIEKIRTFYKDRDNFDSVLLDGSRTVLKKVRSCLERVCPVLIETEQTKYVENVQVAYDAIDVFLDEISTVRNVINFAVPMLGEFKRAVKTKKADEYSIEVTKRCIDRVKEELNLYKSLYDDEERLDRQFAQNALYANKLIELTCRFTEILDKRKRDDDSVSFGDLEHYATRLIGENPDRDFASDYDYVFVDEYQDVNPVQENIISKMVKKNAFFVGDVKQSIYGFRLADPNIFLARKKDYKSSENGDAWQIDFNNNFRSENQILEFVNGIFDVVMTDESANVDYRNEGRFASREEANGKVEVHIFNLRVQGKPLVNGLYDIKADEFHEGRIGNEEEEGAFIATKIKELVSSPSENLTYGDVAILFRSRNSAAERIINAIRQYGIPVDDGAFSKDKEHPENDLISLLSVVDNPRQDFALAGYLLSYLGGYSEDEVATIAKYRDAVLSEKAKKAKDKYLVRADLYDGVLRLKEENTPLGEKVRGTLTKLDEYRLKASFKNVGELISGIVSENYFDAYVAANGDSSLNALNAFMADAFSDENADKSLSAFLRDYKNDSEDKKNGKSSGGDRVIISTFHGYKGLESKVVFVSAADSPIGRTRSADLMISSDGIMGLTYFDDERKSKDNDTLSKTVVKRFIAEKEYKEEMRLAYVALTRAQKYMFVTGSMSSLCSGMDAVVSKLETLEFEHPGSMLGFIFQADTLGKDNRIYLHNEREYAVGMTYLTSDANTLKLLSTGKGNYADLAKSIKKVQEFEYPYSEDTSLAMKYSVSELDGEVDESTVRAFDDRTNIGTSYHKVMQNIDFAVKSADEVKGEMQRMLDEGLLTPEEFGVVNPEDIFRALTTDVMRTAAENECLREQPFMAYKPAKEVVPGSNSDAKVLVQGVVDLIILGKKRGGENIIVDYKYSALTNEDAKKKYEKQLKLYKMASESVVSGKIDRILLLSLKTGKTIEFD